MVDGVGELAAKVAASVLETLHQEFKDFYINPGFQVIRLPDGSEADLREIAFQAWGWWRERATEALGGPCVRRHLSMPLESESQLAFRGLLVLSGEPQPWERWTQGRKVRRHRPAPALSIRAIRRLAGLLPNGEVPPEPAGYHDFDSLELGQVRIPLFGRNAHTGTKPVDFALADCCNLAKLNKWIWEPGRDDYPVARGTGGRLRMHQIVMGATKPGFKIDHIDLNKRNNLKSNLRFATDSVSNQNRGLRSDSETRVKGVTEHKGRKSRPFEAYAKIDGVRKSLGYYATREEAGEVARAARERYAEPAGLTDIVG